MNEEEINRKIQELERRIQTLEGVGIQEGRATDAKKSLSVKEFILSKEPKSDPQRTLTMGYYLEKMKGQEEFTTEEIEEAYRQAKESVSSNTSVSVARNVEKGYIMQGRANRNGKETWTLTNSGEKAVEAGFKGAIMKKRRLRFIKKSEEAAPVVAGVEPAA